MKNTKLLLGALAIGSIAVACNNPPPAMTDAGRDAGMTGDTGGSDTGGSDTGGSDAGPPDTGTPVDCATYCTTITANCTGTDAQYTDAADCMTQCTAAGWAAGTAADAMGNTLGCRIYHATAAAGAASH